MQRKRTGPKVKLTETEHEIRFINSIGTHSPAGQNGDVSRKDLLDGYLLALNKRVNWDGIDPVAVRAFAFNERGRA